MPKYILDLIKLMVVTSLQRTQVKLDPQGCSPEADYNYSDYDLFHLQRNLQPLLYSTQSNLEFGSVKGGQTQTDIDGTVIFVTVKLTPGPEPPELESAVQEALSDPYTLLYYVPAETRWPQFWIRSVLPYIHLAEAPVGAAGKHLGSQIFPEALDAFTENDGLYVKLARDTYFDLQNRILDHITRQLTTWWQQGVHVTTPEFASAWQLQSPQRFLLDLTIQRDSAAGEALLTETVVQTTEGLYGPSWVDARLTGSNPVEFFIQVRKDAELHLPIETTNYVLRHSLASALGKGVTFQRDILVIPVQDYTEAQTIINLIAGVPSFGQVMSIPRPTSEDPIQSVPGAEDAVRYGTQDRLRPVMDSYRVSTVVDPWTAPAALGLV